MQTNIIDLAHYRSTVRAKNGVPFPQVYRLEGFYWDLVRASDKSVPSNRPGPPLYTLSETDDGGYASPSWAAITRLEPPLDNGWIIIRHHMGEESVDGYVDGYMDATFPTKGRASRGVYRTKEGLFTLLHRQAVAGAPDNLLVYVTKMPLTLGPAAGIWADVYHIVHPDGSVSDDPDTLFYPDDEA